jgi:DNA primase catalytic core
MTFPGRIRITPDLVQQVRHAIDIVDIAGAMTSLKRQGRKYTGLCPFHKEKSPSFQVDPQLALYHCFGCGAGGDAIDLYMRHSGDDFPAAIESLARRYGIPLPAPEEDSRGSEGPDPSAAFEEAQAYFQRQLDRSDFPRQYLDGRQISPELRKRYGLGYAPDGWTGLLDALRPRLGADLLLAAGLIGRAEESGRLYDRFRHRLMFPIFSPAGRIVGFGGRTLGDDRAKYVNTAETAFFKKGELLYGLHQAKRGIREAGRAILVEGYFDVLAVAASGIEGAVAGMGTAFTADQARQIARYADEVVMAYDGDDAGRAAAERSLPILLGAGLTVRMAMFPNGEDPDSLRIKEGKEAVGRALAGAVDAIWFDIEKKIPPNTAREPRLQSQAVKAVLELLRPLRDRIVRDGYARRAAQRMGVDEAVLLRPGGAAQIAVNNQERTIVRIEEEKAVLLLFDENEALPPPEQMYPSEIFEDEICRNTYAAFCALYRSGRRAPARREVVDELVERRIPIDRAARILLQEPVPADGAPALQATLATLHTRWVKRRQAELQNEIADALQRNDQTRLVELLEEKKKLTRHLHPGFTGTYTGDPSRELA